MPTQSNWSGVFYQAAMPLGWHPASSVPKETLEQWMHANVILLRALAVFESLPADWEKDFGQNTGKALDRLEAKVDLTLNLLTLLLRQQLSPPLPRPATLSADSIEWIGEEAPPAGSEVAISVWISPKLPQPLVLPAAITAAEPQPGGFRIRAALTHLSPEACDWLERTIFRYHRRAIHQAQPRPEQPGACQ
ncbi:MAG: PilZ domain-containing protein [Pseudomonadota bacterium]|jgi:hypothetical protein